VWGECALECCPHPSDLWAAGHAPFERADDDMQNQEDDADQQRHEDAGVFGIVWDQQNIPGQRQFTAHLDRLPPEDEDRIVAPEECRRAAQRRGGVFADGVATRPEQHSIQQRDPNRPDGHERERNATGRLIILLIARHAQVGLEVAPLVAVAELDRLAAESFEDARRHARHEKERQC